MCRPTNAWSVSTPIPHTPALSVARSVPSPQMPATLKMASGLRARFRSRRWHGTCPGRRSRARKGFSTVMPGSAARAPARNPTMKSCTCRSRRPRDDSHDVRSSPALLHSSGEPAREVGASFVRKTLASRSSAPQPRRAGCREWQTAPSGTWEPPLRARLARRGPRRSGRSPGRARSERLATSSSRTSGETIFPLTPVRRMAWRNGRQMKLAWLQFSETSTTRGWPCTAFYTKAERERSGEGEHENREEARRSRSKTMVLHLGQGLPFSRRVGSFERAVCQLADDSALRRQSSS